MHVMLPARTFALQDDEATGGERKKTQKNPTKARVSERGEQGEATETDRVDERSADSESELQSD